MMISPEGYRKELENLTPEKLYERKKELEKFINDYENNNLPQQDYLVKPSPQTKYKLYKDYLIEIEDLISNRIEKQESNNKDLSDIINKKLEEFDDNTANNLKNYILEIMKKIINLPNDCETTISKLINYNSESNSVDPLTQGIILNTVEEICKEIKINLQSTYDDFGGLAFYYTFIKMKENEVYVSPQKSNDAEIENINKDEDIKTPEICYICYYDFVPYKQIGPIRLNVDDNENYERTGAPHMNNSGINHALCKPLFIDAPETVKRNKNKKDEVYIIYNGIKIKITSYFNTFIEELRKICDDIKLVKIPAGSHTLAVSEQLGIIIRAEEIDNQFLIRFISFCGKDAFSNILKNNLS